MTTQATSEGDSSICTLAVPKRGLPLASLLC
jgi:hypothetical protein